jgi:O-antigen/teichoic acid export membrane protein
MIGNTARLAVRSSIARISVMILGMGIAFFMMPFMIRKLGDTWYGILTLVQVLTGYYYLVDFGLATAVSRYVTLYITKKDIHNANVIINTSFAIYLAMALLICFITMALAHFVGYFVLDRTVLQTVRIVILIMGLQLAFEFPFKAFAGIVGAYMRYDLLSVSHFATIVLSTILTIVFLNKGYGIIAISVIGFICSLISNALFYWIAKRLFKDMRLSKKYYQKERIRELLGYSVWSFLIQVGDQLRFRLDSYVIGWALSAAFVTHFAIGANLANYLKNLIFKATNFLTPMFTKYYAENSMQEVRSKLLFTTKINTILSVFGAGLIIIVGKSFLLRWVGEEYIDAYPVLVILTIAVALEVIQASSINVLMAVAKHRFFAILNAVEGLCNLTISLILVKQYGIVGVALGTLIPIIISRLIILPMYLTNCVGLSLAKYYINIFSVATVTVFYLVALQLTTKNIFNFPHYGKLSMLCVVGSMGYLFLIVIMFFDKTERAFIMNMFPKKIHSFLTIKRN